MKKLALVLGSLLVVGTAASAKEVVPAPVVVPEKVVEIVEKPVIVYRDREVEPTWRPTGSVDVHLRNWGKIENQGKNTDAGWGGKDEWSQLRTTSTINFTPNQTLTIATRHNYGLDSKNNDMSDHNRVELTHLYNFGNLGSSKVSAKLRSQFRHTTDAAKHLETGVVFDFSEYFFKNDYVKATALELAPTYRYQWTKDGDYTNNATLYANAAFELPYGVTFQAEFDDLYNYAVANNSTGKDTKAHTGTVEMTLAKEFELYKEGRHKLGFETELVYATNWSYSKKLDSLNYGDSDLAVDNAAGTVRSNGKKERWGAYSAKIDPHFNYAFQATDFVKLYARVGAEYVNRNTDRHSANYWRWQPYARVGFKASF